MKLMQIKKNSEQCMQLSWYMVHASLASCGILVVSAMNVVVKLGHELQ